MSSPASRASSYRLVCLLLLFFSLLLPAVLSLHALNLNTQSNRIHYVSWSPSGINWEGILPSTHFVDLVLVQPIIQLVVARI